MSTLLNTSVVAHFKHEGATEDAGGTSFFFLFGVFLLFAVFLLFDVFLLDVNMYGMDGSGYLDSVRGGVLDFEQEGVFY